ncbi:hypothetical protein DSQ87_23525 [Salmonella enterica subsp. enterica]|nr:hypothetical protein [Salmonella enterica subsp. enterica serovar Paratyphi A]
MSLLAKTMITMIQKFFLMLLKNLSIKSVQLMLFPQYFKTEPYRVCRRVNILRDYPDDKIKIYP